MKELSWKMLLEEIQKIEPEDESEDNYIKNKKKFINLKMGELEKLWDKRDDKREKKYEKIVEVSDQDYEDAKELMQKDQEFNSNGDKFTLLAVFPTIVLFFAGLCSTFRQFAIKIFFLAGSIVVFIGSLIFMLKSTILNKFSDKLLFFYNIKNLLQKFYIYT